MNVKLKFRILFLSFLFIKIIKSEDQEWVNMKFKYVKCKVLDNSTIKMNKCFIKPYSWNVSTLNIDVDLFKLVRGPIIVEASLFYRYITTFRPIHPTVRFDWCAVMKGYGVMDALMKWILSFFKDTIKPIMHECPFVPGNIFLPNITLAVKNLQANQLFPSGMFKISGSIIVNDDKIVSLDTHVEVSTRMMYDGK